MLLNSLLIEGLSSIIFKYSIESKPLLQIQLGMHMTYSFLSFLGSRGLGLFDRPKQFCTTWI